MMQTMTSLTPVLVSPQRSTSRAYWLCQAFGWTAYSCIILFFSLLYRAKGETVQHVLMSTGAVAIFSITIGILLTHRWRAYIRQKGWIKRSGFSTFLRLAGGILGLALTQFSLIFIFYLVFLPSKPEELAEWMKNGMPGTILGWLSVYLVWTVLYVGVVSRRHVARAEIEKLQLELQMKEAELRALQAQVNPHFFFNSLNSIRALSYQDPQAAGDVIDRLAGMMRYTLQSGQSDTVPLAEEMQAVHNYLAIEKIRFEERLQFSESIQPGLEDMAFPPMALQTLVENAVKYGVETSMTPCELRISVVREGEQMQLTVSNQGQLREVTGSTKVGVRNTGKRLALLFGAEAGIDLFERDGWVNARLVLPCRSATAPCA